MIILYIIIEFLFGSLMFSYWLGLACKKDLSTVGDGNPGAFNLWKAAGYKVGIAGVFLDFMKGYFPLVMLVNGNYVSGLSIAAVGIAPILGHAFSPFMKFKGGKAVAVSFGVWSAVTNFRCSFAYAVILAVLLLIAKFITKGESTTTEADGVMVVLGMWMLGFYIIAYRFPQFLVVLWLQNSILFTYKNKEKLLVFFKDIYSRYAGNDTTSGMR
ncbi:MAG: glycerol-3-phosphate acyltransferase [Clostridiales bacterium]|nr:glycerol-3-phosphate acyltransferase [Clostridiales bacterium]